MASLGLSHVELTVRERYREWHQEVLLGILDVVERSKHALRVDRLRTGNARTMPAFD